MTVDSLCFLIGLVIMIELGYVLRFDAIGFKWGNKLISDVLMLSIVVVCLFAMLLWVCYSLSMSRLYRVGLILFFYFLLLF